MSLVPSVASAAAALVKSIVPFLQAAGYTDAKLREFGFTQTPWRGSAGRALLRYRVSEDSALGVLLRQFFFGEAVAAELVATALPADVLAAFTATGMLVCEGDCFVPGCMLMHFGEMVLACDSVRRVQAGPVSDLVLGVNRPTHILGHCLLPSSGTVLDLGTGCGTLALLAARRGAQRVVGVDVNERAVAFARFNAALHGISNVEFREGDRFAPAEGERFDSIFSNPPFFLSPHSKLLFTNNPFSLDSFVESLARQGPALLNEGGYFQMLCEWVELKGESGRDRLQSWFADAGCDVLVLKDYEIGPVDYALQRGAEGAALHGEATETSLISHAEYFAELGVEKICGGLVMARRGGRWPDGGVRTRHWFVMEDLPNKPASDIGDLLRARFAAEDVLSSEQDGRVLRSKPRLCEGVVLVREAVQDGQAWAVRQTYVMRRGGVERKLAFSEEIAELVAGWDGTRELGEMARTFALERKLPRAQVIGDFVALARRLGALGMVRFG